MKHVVVNLEDIPDGAVWWSDTSQPDPEFDADPPDYSDLDVLDEEHDLYGNHPEDFR